MRRSEPKPLDPGTNCRHTGIRSRVDIILLLRVKRPRLKFCLETFHLLFQGWVSFVSSLPLILFLKGFDTKTEDRIPLIGTTLAGTSRLPTNPVEGRSRCRDPWTSSSEDDSSSKPLYSQNRFSLVGRSSFDQDSPVVWPTRSPTKRFCHRRTKNFTDTCVSLGVYRFFFGSLVSFPVCSGQTTISH